MLLLATITLGCVGEKTAITEDTATSDTFTPVPDVPDVSGDTGQPDTVSVPDTSGPDSTSSDTRDAVTSDIVPDTACTPPYTGTNCKECLDGYVMNADGTCVADCGVCGEHEECRLLDGAATCACVPGYGPDGNDVCYWQSEGVNGGGLIDQNLADHNAWETKLIVFDEARFGTGDGAFEFDSVDTCAEAFMRQRFQMPRFEDAEPLVLELEYISQADQTQYQDDLGAMVRLGDGVMMVPFNYSGSTVRMCLGANAYGGEVQLELIPQLLANACQSGNIGDYVSRLFRRIAIVRAIPGECEAPGVLANGTFTTDTAGWTFSTTGTRTSVTNGMLRVEATAGNSAITASTPLSVPTADALANPALMFSYRSTLGPADYGTSNHYTRLIDVSIHGLRKARLYPIDGAPAKTAVVCLPDWTQGMAYNLVLRGNGASNTSFPEGPLDYYSLYLDNFELVSDPSCAGVDGGFERTPETTPWVVTRTDWSVGDNGIKLDAALAHSGNGVMLFQPGQGQGYYQSAAYQWLRIPQPGAAGNPRLRFWHRAENLPPFQATFIPASPSSLAPTNTWQEVSMCLNKKFGGHLLEYRWAIGSNADAALHRYWLDDVVVELSPNCP